MKNKQLGSIAIFLMGVLVLGAIAVLDNWHKETDTPLFGEKDEVVIEQPAEVEGDKDAAKDDDIIEAEEMSDDEANA